MKTLQAIQIELGIAQHKHTKALLTWRMNALLGQLFDNADREKILEVSGTMVVTVCQFCSSNSIKVPYGQSRPKKLDTSYDNLSGIVVFLGQTNCELSIWESKIISGVLEDEDLELHRDRLFLFLGHILFYLDKLVRETSKHDNLLTVVNQLVAKPNPQRGA